MFRQFLQVTAFVICLCTVSCSRPQRSGKQLSDASAGRDGAIAQAEEYHFLGSVDCKIVYHSLAQDANRDIVAAEGIQLVCDGQPIRLVDGKLIITPRHEQTEPSYWLETVDFGRFKLKPIGELAVFVTPDQERKLQAALAPNADIFSACRHGDLVRVHSLLTNKINLNAANSDGDTPLIVASEARNLTVVQALLSAGANVNARGSLGSTALTRVLLGSPANDSQVAQVALALIAAKIDVNAREINGTALLLAAEQNQPDIVRALLAAGADVGAKDSRGNTALMLATKYGYTDIVQMLQTAGASSKK